MNSSNDSISNSQADSSRSIIQAISIHLFVQITMDNMEIIMRIESIYSFHKEQPSWKNPSTTKTEISQNNQAKLHRERKKETIQTTNPPKCRYFSQSTRRKFVAAVYTYTIRYKHILINDDKNSAGFIELR